MLIDESKWNEGKKVDSETLKLRILDFLRKDTSKAYLSMEIAEGVGMLEEKSSQIIANMVINYFRLSSLNDILNELITEKKVEVREIIGNDGQTAIYYKAIVFDKILI